MSWPSCTKSNTIPTVAVFSHDVNLIRTMSPTFIWLLVIILNNVGGRGESYDEAEADSVTSSKNSCVAEFSRETTGDAFSHCFITFASTWRGQSIMSVDPSCDTNILNQPSSICEKTTPVRASRRLSIKK